MDKLDALRDGCKIMLRWSCYNETPGYAYDLKKMATGWTVMVNFAHPITGKECNYRFSCDDVRVI